MKAVLLVALPCLALLSIAVVGERIERMGQETNRLSAISFDAGYETGRWQAYSAANCDRGLKEACETRAKAERQALCLRRVLSAKHIDSTAIAECQVK